jgi:hypothetical protein
MRLPHLAHAATTKRLLKDVAPANRPVDILGRLIQRGRIFSDICQ